MADEVNAGPVTTPVQPVPEPVVPAAVVPATTPIVPVAPSPSAPEVAEAALETPPDEPNEPDELETVYNWQASEYIHHHKGAAWYMGFAGLIVVLVLVAWLLKSWLTLAVFLVMGGAIVVYARRPPRVLSYSLDHDALTVDKQIMPFSDFRSFGVVPDVEWHTITLEPVKRLSLPIGLLFSDEDLDEIVGHLEQHLPRVDRRPDAVDRLSRYLRF